MQSKLIKNGYVLTYTFPLRWPISTKGNSDVYNRLHVGGIPRCSSV